MTEPVVTGEPVASQPVGSGLWRAAAVAAGVSAAAWRRRDDVPGGPARWERRNHRGETLSLLEGPAWAAGALAGVLTARGLPAGVRAGAALATAGAAVFGALDDLAERGSSKGLAGHLGALARGSVTTGALKVLGIGATGVLSAALLLGRPEAANERRGRLGGLLDVVVAGGVVAGGANLTNLLDLRPGRVLKVVGLTSPLLARGTGPTSLVGAAVGASSVLASADLGEQAMLGDCGANAVGALLGSAVVAGTAAAGRRGRASRAAVLAGILGLTLASERVSFTRVIESTPVLRELDGLGRRSRGSGRVTAGA